MTTLTHRLEEDEEPLARVPEPRAGPQRPHAPGPPRRPSRLLVTRGLVATLALAWIAQQLYGDSPLAAIRLGANAPDLVDAGQVDRLITANWLHGGWAHVGLNGLNLFYLGSVLEQLLGGRRLLVIYLGSCVAGAVGSYLMRIGILSVGASTGVAGLFAALGWLLLRHRGRLPPRLRQAWRPWVLLLCLQVGLETWTSSSLNPFPGLRIDHAAHAGGFAAGFGLAALLTARWPPLMPSPRRSKLLLIPVSLLLGLVTLGLGTSAVRAFSDDPKTLRVMAQAALDRDIDPWFQNAYAWDIAIAPEADRATLEVAEALAERAVAAHAEKNDVSSDSEHQAWWFERGNIVDTLATVQFRLGKLEEAVLTELDADRSPVSHGVELEGAIDSQLARFLLAYASTHDPLYLPEGSAKLDIRLGVRSSDAQRTVLDLDLSAPSDRPMEILATAADEAGAPLGLLRVRVGPTADVPQEHTVDGATAIQSVVVGLIDTEAVTMPDNGFSVDWSPIDPTVAGYPGPFPERSEPERSER